MFFCSAWVCAPYFVSRKRLVCLGMQPGLWCGWCVLCHKPQAPKPECCFVRSEECMKQALASGRRREANVKVMFVNWCEQRLWADFFATGGEKNRRRQVRDFWIFWITLYGCIQKAGWHFMGCWGPYTLFRGRVGEQWFLDVDNVLSLEYCNEKCHWFDFLSKNTSS